MSFRCLILSRRSAVSERSSLDLRTETAALEEEGKNVAAFPGNAHRGREFLSELGTALKMPSKPKHNDKLQTLNTFLSSKI